jgi:hypothetical protein
MDPDIDIETRTLSDQPRRRASRAPWDPPRRPPKPSALRRRTGEGHAEEPAVLEGYYDDLCAGAD